MKITIAERLHPYSHELGTKFLLPKTSWSVQVFPTRLNFSDLTGKGEPFFLEFEMAGPIKDFTAELDLERGCLFVFGVTRRGYMRYEIGVRDGSVCLTMEKTPGESVMCRHSSGEFSLQKGELHSLVKSGVVVASLGERLSLGMHKAQDWDLVRRRLDCKEIFPHWFALSGLCPEAGVGNFTLLDICRKKIEQRERTSVLEAFENLFLASFDGVLVPRLHDSEYQGIENSQVAAISPLPLLVEGGKLIRSLFIQEKQGELWLLPCLPSQFHAGRMVGVRTTGADCLSLEWTKKELRRVEIQAVSNTEMRLRLPKGIRSFRQKGKTVDVDSEGRAVLSLEAGKSVQLDRFEH